MSLLGSREQRYTKKKHDRLVLNYQIGDVKKKKREEKKKKRLVTSQCRREREFQARGWDGEVVER